MAWSIFIKQCRLYFGILSDNNRTFYHKEIFKTRSDNNYGENMGKVWLCPLQIVHDCSDVNIGPSTLGRPLWTVHKIKPYQKRLLIWFYFGKRTEDEPEEKQSDLHSGQSLLEDELEVGEKAGQVALDQSERRKERKKFIVKALTLFACSSTLWSSLIFYGLLQVGLKQKSWFSGRKPDGEPDYYDLGQPCNP